MKKTIHMAMFVDGYGNVSALCFKGPRAINAGRATWTNRAESVTCPRCKAALQDGRDADEVVKPQLRGFPS